MRAPLINPYHLITFYFVAKENSFTVAANNLCISQPAVSMQVKALERQFGVKLIHVKKKRVYLTAEGEALLPQAEGVYHSSIAAERLLLHHGESGCLRIGIATALTLHLFPLVERFRDRYPSARVTLREGTSLRLVEELLDFKHDLCLVASSGQPRKNLKVFHARQTEKMVLVASPESPIAQKNEVGWKDLEHYPLILHGEGSVARKRMLEQLEKRGLRPRIATEIDNISGMKRLIQQDKGVGLMYLPNVKDEVADDTLAILPFDCGEVQLGIDVVMRREAEIVAPCAAFLGLVEEHFGEDMEET